MATTVNFTATVIAGSRQRALIPLPFDPDEEWGRKRTHRVGGTINGAKVRAIIEHSGDGPCIVLTPMWRRDSGVSAGDEVTVTLTPEGPQRADLAPDVAAALDAEPAAAEFFDSLAQFYRKAYLRWIDATKRRPDIRAERITEMIELLKAGKKERPTAPGTST
ncbi:YdeI/OmpD-associated family protein [Actinopolymorpha alba]|uniref:YdeI/OmpD-associated family protein n=1 Tax=Actinopolymorpha alba TaxID=533267 RepID=UPI00037E27D3|nr:YdeI/OmpD-associated family protein [Actinopolymorpha alba]